MPAWAVLDAFMGVCGPCLKPVCYWYLVLLQFCAEQPSTEKLGVPAGIALVKLVISWCLVQNRIFGECLGDEMETKRLSQFPLPLSLLGPISPPFVL